MRATYNGQTINGKNPLITGVDMRVMRLRAKKTTTEMAKIAGVKTRKTYENWEKNIGYPSVNQYLALVIACEFDPAALMDEFVKRWNTSLSAVDPDRIDWDACRFLKNEVNS